MVPSPNNPTVSKLIMLKILRAKNSKQKPTKKEGTIFETRTKP